MLKKIVIAVLLFSLWGCSTVPNVETMVQNSFAKPMTPGTNYNKRYFRYYLPLDASLRESTQISSLVYYKRIILIQLNVSEIVAKQYYSETDTQKSWLEIDDEYGYTQLEGVYYDRDNLEKKYVLAYKEVKDQYIFILKNQDVEMTSIVPLSDAEITLETMITIMRSVEVDEALVVSTFSNKEIINYKPIREEFFEVAIPESGSLLDMYNRLNPDNKIESLDDRKE